MVSNAVSTISFYVSSLASFLSWSGYVFINLNKVSNCLVNLPPDKLAIYDIPSREAKMTFLELFLS